MSTHVTTQNLVRSDVADAAPADSTRRTGSRSWALAGIGAGLAGIGTVVTSGMVDGVYDKDLVGDPAGIHARLADLTGVMVAFHTVTAIGAVLLLVFAAGLYRRMRATAGDSIAPLVAFAGLIGTSFVSIMGSGLDTEFIFALGEKDAIHDANAALYNHWIGTIPWLWTLAGLAGLALFSVYRRGGVARWMGITGLVLGGLTVLLGLSPLQYMAGMTGPLMVLVLAIGFVVGDKAFRRS